MTGYLEEFRQPNITAIILAGGRAKRMGGEDKGLILLHGRPMLEHVLNRIRPQVDNIIINANRNQEQYGTFGHQVISDHDKDFRGPLSGVASIMQTVSSNYFITVPCDTPLLPLDLVKRLYTALKDKNAICSVVHNGESIQPVFALFKNSAGLSLSSFIHDGERKVRLWHNLNNSIMVDFSNSADAFFNINTPEQLLAIEQRLTDQLNPDLSPYGSTRGC